MSDDVDRGEIWKDPDPLRPRHLVSVSTKTQSFDGGETWVSTHQEGGEDGSLPLGTTIGDCVTFFQRALREIEDRGTRCTATGWRPDRLPAVCEAKPQTGPERFERALCWHPWWKQL